MSCYLRHLGELLNKAGWGNTREDRKRADRAIQQIVDRVDEHCPVIWREVKKWLGDPVKEAELSRRLRESRET